MTRDTSQSAVPAYAMRRALHKRQRLAVHEKFEAERTALLVLDMQCHYLDSMPGMRDLVPSINRLASTLRMRGTRIIWILNTLERNGVDQWPEYHRDFFTAEQAARHRAGLASGAPGHALLPELAMNPDDLLLEKTRFSPFVPGSSILTEELVAQGIENVLITGVAANVCCESTARDAMMRGWRVTVVADAMAALSDSDHAAGLATLFSCFADVRSTDDVIGQLVVA